MIQGIKLRLLPVGIKLFEDEARLETLGVKPYEKNLALCQYLKAAALYAKPFGLVPDNVDACVFGTRILGLRELPLDLEKRWVDLYGYTPDLFRKLVESAYSVELGRYRAAVIAPLRFFEVKNLEPDAVVTIVNSAQAYLLLAGFFDATGRKPWSDFNGHAACEVLTAPLLKSSPWLTIPCGGARALAEAQDDELWIGWRPKDLETAVERLRRAGMRYQPPLMQMLLIPPQPEFVLTKLIAREAR